ncbi:thioredoxin family protein [Magnetococcales bacterium HHB-1]
MNENASHASEPLNRLIAQIHRHSQERYFVINFSAPWCGPCKKQYKILKKWAPEHRQLLEMIKVDLGKYPEIGHHFNVQSIPQMVVFHQGKEIWRKAGLQDKSKLKKLRKHLEEKYAPEKERSSFSWLGF